MNTPIVSISARAALAATLVAQAGQVWAITPDITITPLPAPLALVFGGVALVVTGAMGRGRSKAKDTAKRASQDQSADAGK